MVSSLRDDLVGGTWTLYYDAEKTRKIEQCSYKNEKRNGEHITWYLNQQMRTQVAYKNGDKTGTETRWYENGQMMSQTSAHSITDTVCDRVEWYKTGEVRYKEKRDGDKRLSTVYYPDGTIKCERVEMYSKDPKLLLPQYVLMSEVCRCKNGNTLYDYTTKQGEKTAYKEYHCNGNLKMQGTMVQSRDFKVGKWSYYRIDGTPEHVELYKDADTPVKANIKDGIWIYYRDSGEIAREETYQDGVLMESHFAD